MIEKTAEKIVIWLIKEKAIEAQDKELYKFAVRCLLLFIFPSLVSFISACIIGIPLNSILIILPFVCVRKYSGGVHSKSENTCLIMSSLILIAGNWISLYAGWGLLELIISGISVLGLINSSPIQNENKLLEASEQIKYKCITAVISCGFYLLAFILFIAGETRLYVCISLGLILSFGLQVPCVIKRLICKRGDCNEL